MIVLVLNERAFASTVVAPRKPFDVKALRAQFNHDICRRSDGQRVQRGHSLLRAAQVKRRITTAHVVRVSNGTINHGCASIGRHGVHLVQDAHLQIDQPVIVLAVVALTVVPHAIKRLLKTYQGRNILPARRNINRGGVEAHQSDLRAIQEGVILRGPSRCKVVSAKGHATVRKLFRLVGPMVTARVLPKVDEQVEGIVIALPCGHDRAHDVQLRQGRLGEIRVSCTKSALRDGYVGVHQLDQAVPINIQVDNGTIIQVDNGTIAVRKARICRSKHRRTSGQAKDLLSADFSEHSSSPVEFAASAVY